MLSNIKQKITGLCRICGGQNFVTIDFNSYTSKAESSNPSLNEFQSIICDSCGVVAPFPPPNMNKLKQHYNSKYRHSTSVLNFEENYIEPPIQFESTQVSFKRAQAFFDIIRKLKSEIPDIEPSTKDLIIDYGSYQGVFLNTLVDYWKCSGIAYDFNQAGIRFAKRAFGLTESVVAEDIYTDVFHEKARFITSIHNFEHLDDPIRFLNHIKENVLLHNGWLYIEVPNLYGFPLSDPTHFFTYSEDSLRYTIEKGGFHAECIWLTGKPSYSNPMWNTGHQNLHCIAKVAENSAKKTTSLAKADIIYKKLRKSYRTTSIKFILNQYKELFRFIIRTLIHTLGVILLDLMPTFIAKKINFYSILDYLIKIKNMLLKIKQSKISRK